MNRTLSNFTKQYTLFFLIVINLIQTSMAFSYDKVENIPLSKLGKFETTFSEIKNIDFIEGQPVIAEVNIKTGENYSVNFPFNVQQIRYHIKNGELINKGDTIATVEGYDVHHFIDTYKSTQKILEISKNHYQTNQVYFNKKSIQNSQWIEITKNYFDAKLNFEHINHQMDFLHIDEHENVTMISPKKGMIKIPELSGNRLEGDLAFDVIDSSSIQVKITMPKLNISSISHFIINSKCSLSIDNIESISDKYHQKVWAKPDNGSDCNLSLGQVLKITPIHVFNGYKINKSAVFEFEDKDHIAIKSGNEIIVINIDLFGSKDDYYYFTTNRPLENYEALTSSLSILQGYLLKLGTE